MKRVATFVAILLAFGFGAYALTASDYQGGIAFRATTGAQAQNVIFGVTPLGRMDLIGGATFDNTVSTTLTITETNINLVGTLGFTGGLTVTGDLSVDGATVLLDGSTSVRGVSAGFTSLESPANRFGVNATVYTQFAATATTGVTAVTHTGTAPTMSWTVPVWTNTNSTSYTTYTPSFVFGYDAGAAMTFAVTDTTGAVAITHAGSGAAVTWTAPSLAFTGDFSSDGATAALDGSTSVRNISAGFVSSEGPAIRFGANATEYMQVAVTGTTGATAITHTGSGPAVTWAADSLAFTGNFSSDGATAALDGSTSVRGISAGFTSLESPANRFGVNATEYMQIATVATTGATTITHTGTTPTVTWTADSFDFVGPTALDATTLSDVLTFSDAGTIDNTDANTLTITEVNIVLEGITKTNSIIIDDGDADVTIDSDNQTTASATINIPDFADASADFLVTNIFTTVIPFHGGLAGEDTDAVGTNGGGFVGAGAIDTATYDYNDGAAGANDVLVKVYDFGTTTWDDLKTAALLTAGADWAINYQLLPDADAEEAGDAFAVGFGEKFCAFAFNDLATNNGTLATWGGNGAKWQYSTGAGTWSDLTVYDGTDSTAQDGLRPLQRAGEITFVPPADWALATYDGEEAYWVQCVITAAQLTQTPVIDDTNKDEPILPFPTDGLAAPFKMEITKVRVANMHTTVHDQAIVFIVGNFTDGVFTAAQTWAASQTCDTFTLASALAFDPGDVIAIMCTNDTGSTNNPVWAVEFTATYED